MKTWVAGEAVNASDLNANFNSALHFGGTGADGALTITSGTTTINCGNAAVVIKNYTSISITGTGVLAFSNPNTNGTIVILKSQGNVTLTSSATPMIDMSGMGGAGGSGGNGVAAGNGGSSGVGSMFSAGGGGGGAASGGGGNGGGSGGAAVSGYTRMIYKGVVVTVGAGGGGGGGGTSQTGNGALGGGGLVIECGGALNFTTSNGISVAGKNAANAGSGHGSGGGGGGGSCYIFYNSLTANTGTINVSGGTHGTSSSSNVGGGGGGGGGIAAGSGGSSNGDGGDGGTGFSLVAQNTEFS